MLGLAPPETDTTDTTDDSSLPYSPGVAAAGDTSGDPGASAANDAPPGPVSNQPTAPPTKLDGLRALLRQSQGPTLPPDMGVGTPQPGDTSGVGDITRGMAAGPAPRKATFPEAHPLLAKFLRGGLGAAEGGLIGSQYANAGQGYEAARMAPLQMMMAGLGVQKERTDIAHTQAQTKEIQSHMEDIPVVVNGVTYMLPKDKVSSSLITSGTRKDIADQSDETKRLIGLRNKGLKPDANGNPVSIPYEEMSPTEQAAFDLKGAQQEAAQARAAMDKAKNDPNSPAYKAAWGRLRVAQQNAGTAAGRLGLEKAKYVADYFGTDAQGNALPGIALTESGAPIGTRVSNVTKPTNATRSKAEQAIIVKQQGNDLIKQIDANPQLFGALMGRWNNLNAGNYTGVSPEVRDAYTSLKSFSALQPSLHGSRGIGMQKEFEDAVGSMAQNPEGLKASIRSLMRTAAAFQKAGTITTNQGGTSPNAGTQTTKNKFGFVPIEAPK